MTEPEREKIDGERLARFIAGECTDEERAAIQTWIDAEPSRENLVRSLEDVWKLTAPGEQWNAERAWLEHLTRRRTGSRELPDSRRNLPGAVRIRGRVPVWAARVAAALALLVGGAIVWTQVERPARTSDSLGVREFTTGLAERTDVVLPDGSVVTLAPRSRLRPAAGFGDDAREVQLEGQAAFQVAHDARRPFRVRTSAVVTEVLGTRFVVRAYADDPESFVALFDGGVRVHSPDDDRGSNALTMRPGQVVRAAAGSPLRIDAEASTDAFLAWTEDQLVFRDTPLAQVVSELSRWYDIDIRLADSALAGRKLTASFAREPADQIIELISLSLNLRYERAGRDFVLTSR